jgi:hypothetical protein
VNTVENSGGGEMQRQIEPYVGTLNLRCQECGKLVETRYKQTFDNTTRKSVLEVEEPKHEHRIEFERKVIGSF